MIDTDKYEGHTEGHWATTTRKGTWVVYTQDNGDVATMNDYEDAKLIADAPKLLAEVKRLREKLDKAEQERDKNSGALNIALEHLGYQGADHEQFCKEQYECNVYGDELIKCDNIECGGFLVDRYGDYVSTISLSESVGCKDEDCCNYYKGSEEE